MQVRRFGSLALRQYEKASPKRLYSALASNIVLRSVLRSPYPVPTILLLVKSIGHVI